MLKRLFLLLVLASVCLGLAGCDEGDLFGEANIYVTNQLSHEVDIYMDGVYRFRLAAYGGTGVIRDVDWEDHLMEAVRISDGAIVRSRIIRVLADLDYEWFLEP